MTTKPNTPVTSSGITYQFADVEPLDWSSLELSLDGLGGWAKTVTSSEDAVQSDGTFTVVTMEDGTTRIRFSPRSGTPLTEGDILPAEVFFRINEGGNSPQSSSGLISAVVTNIAPAAPEVAPVSGSTGPLNDLILRPDATGAEPFTYCIFEIGTTPTTPCTQSTAQGSSSSWTLRPDGSVSFSAAADASGTKEVNYRVIDPYGQSASAVLSVTILAPADPTISAENVNTTTGQLVTISPTLTASSSFTICIVVSAVCQSTLTNSQGTWNVVGNKLEFTSLNTFIGSATVSARITDALGKTADATQTVNVTAPAAPTVADVSGSTTTTSPKTVTPVPNSTLPTTGCFEDDQNPGNCTTSPVAQAGVGSWNAAGGNATFTAEAGFTGSATISYLVTDTLGQTGSATISILVNSEGVQNLAATTEPATSVATTTATLNGSIVASAVTSNAFFCYDTQSNLSSCTLVPASPPTVAGNGSASVSLAITGLTAGTEYFFKVVGGDGVSTESGSVLSFSTQVAAASTPTESAAPAPAPAPEPIAPATSDPCVPEVALTSQETALLPYFAETFQVLVTGVAGSVGHGLDSLAANKLSLGLSLATIASSNPLLLSANVLQGFGEGMFEISFNTKAQKQMQALTPEDVVLSPGTQMGDVELTSTDGQPLELLSIQSIDLNLYVDFSGAELNNPLLWQNLGYGLLCWKLEPFTETSFVLPNPIQLPANTPPGNWVYSNVIVKAGSATTDPTTFQANTLFPKPGPGQAVWADVNGNGIYDPGGKNGDKAISHIKICADLLVESDAPTPTPTPTPTTTSPVAPSPTATPTPTPTPTQSQVMPATPAPQLLPTSSSSATPAPSPTVNNCVSPSPTSSAQVPTPMPTNTVDNPPIARPTPISPTMPPVVIRVEPLGIPTPTPTTPGVTPSPTPTTPGVAPTPGQETPAQTPNPQIDLSAPTECVPDSNFSVAMKVSNGLSTTCLRVTSVFFSQIAFMQRPLLFDEDIVTTQDLEDEVLADTGVETSSLVLWALMMFGAGFVFLAFARRRV